MKKLFCYFVIVGMLYFCQACTGSIDAPWDSETDALSLNSEISEDATPCLSFESSKDFSKFVQKIASLSTTEEKLQFVSENFPNFISAQHYLQQALDEMETNVDESKESYLALMDKYPTLYYPLHEEDAGVYIPMTNLDASYLVNKDYNVIIAGQKCNLKDIDNYETLMLTGRAYYPPQKQQTRSEYTQFNYYGDPINTIGEEYDSGWTEYKDPDRKVQLKARRRIILNTSFPATNLSMLHTEFCFRKKTVFGWANSNSKSQMTGHMIGDGIGQSPLNNQEHSSNSSHDDDFIVPVILSFVNGEFGYTFPKLTCHAEILYRGVATMLVYDWTMNGAYCKNPGKTNIEPNVGYKP